MLNKRKQNLKIKLDQKTFIIVNVSQYHSSIIVTGFPFLRRQKLMILTTMKQQSFLAVTGFSFLRRQMKMGIFIFPFPTRTPTSLVLRFDNNSTCCPFKVYLILPEKINWS